MKRGFSVLELLVATLLLGMLTTILTMVFNQSSIAWRTGTALVADLDEVRDKMAVLREESDNAFMWNDKLYRHVSVWDSKGNLHYRTVCGEDAGDVKFTAETSEGASFAPNMLKQQMNNQNTAWSVAQNVFPVGQGDSGGNGDTYIVNVMSAGPDRVFDTWDDIWSFPDDFE